MSFDRSSRTARSANGDLVWDVPAGWRQGRGAFGGLTLATLARAASAEPAARDRALRTITAEIPRAVMTGPATIHLTTLHAGSGLGTIAARLEQSAEPSGAPSVAAHAVFAFGKTRVTDFDRVGTPPPPPSSTFEDVPIIRIDLAGGPEFAQHLEYRIMRGLPFSGESGTEVDGWVRLRDPGDTPRDIALVALLDGWFPTVLPGLTEMRPFGTIAFAAHLFDRQWSLDEPLRHRARMIGAQDGYFVELRELFTPSGELCAVNQQTFAVIR